MELIIGILSTALTICVVALITVMRKYADIKRHERFEEVLEEGEEFTERELEPYVEKSRYYFLTNILRLNGEYDTPLKN